MTLLDFNVAAVSEANARTWDFLKHKHCVVIDGS